MLILPDVDYTAPGAVAERTRIGYLRWLGSYGPGGEAERPVQCRADHYLLPDGSAEVERCQPHRDALGRWVHGDFTVRFAPGTWRIVCPAAGGFGSAGGWFVEEAAR